MLKNGWKKGIDFHNQNYLYTAFLFLTLLGICAYGIPQIYGMVEYPDEFGYWSTAAGLLGWDWSPLASRGSYYSFGYSLVLFPILKFCEDSITAYRMAVGVNFICIALSFFLLKWMYEQIFTEQVEGEAVFTIGMSLLYPAWCFYAQMTLVDSFLNFMVILLCFLWIRFTKVPSLFRGIQLVLAVIYTYSLHMRSAGIAAAVILALVLWMVDHPAYGKKILLLLLAMGLLLILVSGVKEVIQQTVFSYAEKEQLNINDYGGQWSKIEFLFSKEGIRQLYVVTMGKLLYAGLASAGLCYGGMLWCAKQGKALWSKKYRKKETQKSATDTKESTKQWLGVLLGLLMAGQMAVAVIYTIHTDNADFLIYGRYIEAILPISIFVGAGSLLEDGGTKKKTTAFLLLYTLAAISCICKVWGQPETNIRGEHSVAAVFLTEGGKVDPVLFFGKIWAVGMVLMLLAGIAFRWFRKKRLSAGIVLLWFLTAAVWGVSAGEDYTYLGNDHMAGEQIIVTVLQEKMAEGKQVYYLEEENAEWIDFVQMQLREKTLNVITWEEWNKMDAAQCVMVVDGESDHLKEMQETYRQKITGNYHYVFYNR